MRVRGVHPPYSEEKRDSGVVDDFGTGYSSLSYLNNSLSMLSKSTGRSLWDQYQPGETRIVNASSTWPKP